MTKGAHDFHRAWRETGKGQDYHHKGDQELFPNHSLQCGYLDLSSYYHPYRHYFNLFSIQKPHKKNKSSDEVISHILECMDSFRAVSYTHLGIQQ